MRSALSGSVARMWGDSVTRSIFSPTVFSRSMPKVKPRFLRPMHPKAAIRANREAITKILAAGWVGQLKIHGHRAQIHIPSDRSQGVVAYTRHGKRHSTPMPEGMISELFRIFSPLKGWNVIDAEWVKENKKLYVFDLIVQEGEALHRLTFPERWKRLSREYLSPHLATLPQLLTLEDCMKALQSTKPYVEGLVFKSIHSPGFEDRSIVRCRRVVA